MYCMKYIVVVLAALAALDVGSGAWAAPPPRPKPLKLQASRPTRPGAPRWIENYRFLADPAKRTDLWDPIRYMPLGRTAWLQVGGEYRLRLDDFKAEPTFGLKGYDKDAFVLKRALVHADLHLFDDLMRVYAELGDTRATGKAQPVSPVEATDTSLQQMFVDLNLHAGGGRLTLRAGRQELGLGSQRLVTYRDGPNVRLSFDGVRAMYHRRRLNLSVFAVRPIAYGAGNFNDKGLSSQAFYGAYASVAPKRPQARTAAWLDLYLFGLNRAQTSVDGFSGRLHRYTAGARLYGNAGPLDWDADLAYQFGRIGGADIRAYAIGSTSGYTFATPWRPRLGLRFDLASGDRHRGDATAGTFDPMYPRNGYYSDGSFTTLANLRALGPALQLHPARQLALAAEALRAWRQSTQDAAYTPNLVPVPGTGSVAGHGLGRIYKLEATWWPDANLTLFAQYVYYDVDGAIERAGGRNARYLEVRAGYRF